ncbi:MAG: response regulator, partial [Pseudomonadales bacterium]
VWNLDSNVFEGSNECMRLLGFSVDDSVVDGVKAYALLHEDDREMVMIATEHSGEFDYECRINPADGAPMRHLHAWGTIKREEGERIVRGVFQDITAHKEAEREKAHIAAQMQESQRLESLGILAGGIAHDFNNLLAGILGNADLALAESGLPSMVQDRLHDVVTASKRAADLTRQLLAYSGKGRFVIETANLTDLVEEMASLLEISIAKNCVLEFHLERDLPVIEVDSTQIRQVIMNLILNASEAVEHARGVVRLSTGVQPYDAAYLDDIGLAGEIDPGEYVFLEVSDNGIGMDAETQARIFEPFFTTKFTGRGLGMSAVQGIIKGHFGALHICSKLGKGTTFKVLLPVSKSTVSTLPEEVRKVTRTGSGCVLVVDDEQAVRDLIQRILQVQGYEVLLAKDGLEGIGTFAANAARIDLVLLDLTMPDVDGDETFRRILQIKSDVKVVLMSGYNEQDATQRFVGKSLAGFLAKPFLVDDLRRKVEEVLDTHGES